MTNRYKKTTGGKPTGGRREGRQRFYARRRVCNFCVDKITFVDYKDTETLTRYITERAKMSARHRTGACAKHQRLVSRAIKRARHVALLPYVADLDQKMPMRPRAIPSEKPAAAVAEVADDKASKPADVAEVADDKAS